MVDMVATFPTAESLGMFLQARLACDVGLHLEDCSCVSSMEDTTSVGRTCNSAHPLAINHASAIRHLGETASGAGFPGESYGNDAGLGEQVSLEGVRCLCQASGTIKAFLRHCVLLMSFSEEPCSIMLGHCDEANLEHLKHVEAPGALVISLWLLAGPPYPVPLPVAQERLLNGQ